VRSLTAMAPANLHIRTAGTEDIAVLAALRHQVGWGTGGLEGSFLAVAEGRQVILLADVAGVSVGAVTVNLPSRWAPTLFAGHISDLLVTPPWRGRGIGSALLAAAESAVAGRGLRDVTLDVESSNAVALHLYLSRGYQRQRAIQFPWGPGYTMRKHLSSARSAARPFLSRWLGRHRQA
jgi:ribosomal protein S18 acetylase RimI-like enzyme